MIDCGKKDILGVRVDGVDYDAAVSRVLVAAHAGEKLTASALAVHGIMTGVLDPLQRYRLNQLDLVVPDGQPVRWAMGWLHGIRLPDRVYGPTLMLRVCERAAKEALSVYLYGSREEVLRRLCDNLRARVPGLVIAGAQPSRFRQLTMEEKEGIIEEIRRSGAAITFVGLGCPRQEVWVYEFGDALSQPVMAVGAAFDFHSGMLKQAPPVLRRHGLEWLFRLACEPVRLWQRYLLLNPLYLVLIALQALRVMRIDPESAVRPTQELRFG